MRILSVIASLDPVGGGVPMAARQIVQQFISRGIECEIVCVDAPSSCYPEDEHLIVHRLGPGRFGYAWTPQLVPWLKANRHRFDAVICHGLWLFPSYAVWRVLGGKAGSQRSGNRGQRTEDRGQTALPQPRLDISKGTPQSLRQRDKSEDNGIAASHTPPYLVFSHGMLDPWFQRLDVRPFKSIRNSIYWRLVEWRVLRDATAVCFTCEEERRLARTTFRPYQARELVVPYGVESPPPFRSEMLDAFRGRCPELGDRPYLLFLGRVHPKKGVEMLVKAYAEIGRSEDGRWKLGGGGKIPALVIAGPGLDTAYGREMTALAKSLNLAPTCSSQLPASSAQLLTSNSQLQPVFFPGMLEGDAKWGAFYGCEAFVLPSHQENFGIAVVEALACGKPVLLSDKVNIWREIEEDGAALVEPDTQEGTTQLLRRWFETGADRRAAMAIAGRACFANRFTIENVAKALLEAIRGKVEVEV